MRALFLMIGLSLAPTFSRAATNLFPAAAATGICVDTPLKLSFDTVPTIGTNGQVRIYRSDGLLVETIDLSLTATNGTQPRLIGGTTYNVYPILVDGVEAIIMPKAGALAYSTTYYVTIDADVFPGFAGISGSTAWRFTTRSSPSTSAAFFTVNAAGGGDFCTVQGVIDFLPAGNTTRRTINIRNGIYREIVRIPSKHNLVFRGQNPQRTVIAYPNNDRINPGTNTRPLVGVFANDIVFHSLGLSNTTPDGGSQAEALRVSGARCIVSASRLQSYQDTLLINGATDTAFFIDSLIAGDADFIWGSGRAVFERCEIRSLSGGYLCMSRNPAGQYGFVFLDCRLTREAGVTGVYLARIDPNVYPYSAAAFVNCAMDAHIASAGWLLTASGPTADLKFWEYQSTDLAGVPLNVSGRAAFSTQISAAQAAALRDQATTLGGWKPVPPAVAFPGAEGTGAYALGGRGGDVYFVTTLADSGAGSLREAIATAPAAGRTVIFKVSGTIALASTLTINKPRITVAGQTAPGDGICLKNYTLRIQADDLIVRHIRSRLGIDALREDDAITIWSGINVMLDHCSASWSVDEVFSITGQSDNISVQWCFISEALDNSIHTKGPHGFGSIIASYLPARISLHHNLYAHNQSRNPRPGNYAPETLHLDFRNNVIYNWGYFCGYDAGEPIDMNYMANYLVKGAGSTTDTAFRGGGLPTRIYQSGNKIDLNRNGAFDGTDTGWAMFGGTYTPVTERFDAIQDPGVESADRALQRVLSQVGAFPWRRDAKDATVVANVRYGTGGFVDTVEEAGGYPILATAAPYADSDNDGLPDYWESALGSNPAVANNNADADGDGYTDLEDYLNWLAAPHTVTPTDVPVEVDLALLNGSRTGLVYAVSGATNGTATLLGDGRTARFTPTAAFRGLGAFDFLFTSPEGTVTQTVGICVTDGLPRNLVWNGSTATWDVAVTTNFLSGAQNAAFAQGDNVTFSAAGNVTNVTLAGSLLPGSVIVDGEKNYTFSGAGIMSGAMGLMKAGPGRLLLNTTNTYAGGTTVNGGTLTLGHAAAVGSGPIAFDGASFVFGAVNVTNRLVFSGSNTASGGNSGRLNAMEGDGTVNLTVTSGVVDLGGDLTGFSGTLSVRSSSTVRFLGSTGSDAATFDLAGASANLSIRNTASAIALGALTGGSGTAVRGMSNYNLPATFTIGANNRDALFAGMIADGTGGTAALSALTKTGSGTFTLAGSNTYTGATAVDVGCLRVDGSLAATPVTVSDGARLAGTGRLTGSLTMRTGSQLSPGADDAVPARLTLGNSLALQGATLPFALRGSPVAVSDQLTMSGGTLALSGTNTFFFTLLDTVLAGGTYALITGGTATTGGLVNLAHNLTDTGRQHFVLTTNVPGTVNLVVTGDAATLVWTGAAGAAWDRTTTNWLNGGASDRFIDEDAVRFDDTAAAGVVTISGAPVRPRSMVVTNATRAYTIGGSGIEGTTMLVKQGNGTLTIDASNTYSGGTRLFGGTLTLASDMANTNGLGSGPVMFEGGTLTMYSNFNTYNRFNEDLVVAAGQRGRINADSRVDVYGTLSGSGILDFSIPNIRTTLYGDWSAFAGTLNVIGPAGGMPLRMATGFNLPVARVELSTNMYAEYVSTLADGTEVELGALAGAAGTLLRGGPTTGHRLSYRVGGRNDAAVFNGVISEQVSGGLTEVVKVGSGLWTLGGVVTNTGGIRVEAGTLVLAGSAVVSNAAPLDVMSGATLDIQGAALTLSMLTLAPGATATAVGRLTGNLWNGGTLTLTGVLPVSGFFENSGTLNLNGGAVDYSTWGLLGGDGQINVALGMGSSTTLINGDHSGFTGTWTIGVGAPAGAGKAQMNGMDNVSARVEVSSNATVYVSGTATRRAAIVLNGGDTGESYGQLRLETGATWAGPVTLAGTITGTGDARVGTLFGSGTISGSIGESGGAQVLSKGGEGTLVLSATNTYSGGTLVNTGTVTVARGGTLGTGDLTVGAGAVCALQTTAGAVADTASVRLNGRGAVNLSAGVSESVRQLYIDGVMQAAGVWDTARDPVHILGSGKLVVTEGTTVVDGIWTNLLGGAWNVAGNWQYAAIAAGVGKRATFAVTTGVVVTQDQAACTIGHLLFSNANHTVTGNVLTLAAPAPSITVAASRTATLAAPLAGTNGFVKSGAGVLTLSGDNTYGGVTAIEGGAVLAQHADAFGAANAGTTVASGAGLRLANGVVVSNETATISGGGTGDYNGALQAVPNSVAEWAGPVVIGDPAARVGAGLNSTLTLSGPILGSGTNQSLLISAGTGGRGTVVLAGSGSYTGVTAIVRGTVKLGAANALATNAVLDVDSGSAPESSVFDLNGVSQTVAGLRSSGAGSGAGGGWVTNSGAASATLTVALVTNEMVYSGRLLDDGVNKLALTKKGAGTLVLGGTNTFTGDVTVPAGGHGDLVARNSSAFGIGPKTIWALGNTGANRATLVFDGVAGNLLFAANLAFRTSNDSLSDPAIRNIAGDNTISGPLQLDAGGGASAIVSESGTLTLGSVSSVYASSGRALMLGGTSSGVVSGVIANGSSTVSLSKDGVGTWTLTGANTFTGNTTINAGVLRVGAPSGAATSGTLVTSGSISNNAALVFRRTDTSELNLAKGISGTGSVAYEGTGILNQSQYKADDACTYSGGTAISASRLSLTVANGLGSGPVLIEAGGQVFVNAAITVTNALTLAGLGWSESAGQLGVLRLANGSVLSGPISLAADVRLTGNNGSATISGSINGVFGVEIGEDTVAGSLIFTGANSYTGLTTVNFGVLNIRHSQALGTTDGGTVIASGRALQLQGGIAVGAEPLTLNGMGVTSTGALRNMSDDNIYAGPIALGSASRINSDANLLTLDVASGNAISAVNQNLVFGGAGAITVADPVSLGSGSLLKDGAGVLTISAMNSYSGGTVLSNGTLRITTPSALPGTGLLKLCTGTTLDIAGGSPIGALATVASFDSAGGTLRLSTADRLSVSGPMTGQLAVAISDPQNLDANQEYVLATYDGTPPDSVILSGLNGWIIRAVNQEIRLVKEKGTLLYVL